MTTSVTPTLSSTDDQSRPPGTRAWRARRRRSTGWLYMAPAFLLVLAVTAYPLYFAARYSVFRMRMWEPVEFVGLDNYVHLLTEPRFLSNLVASAVYVFAGVVGCAGIGLGLALALRSGSRWQRLLRTFILIPWITSEVVVAITWRWLLNPQYGPLTAVFERFGLPDFPNVFASETSALVALTLVNVWRSLAFPMLMFLAALQAVPKQTEEAAQVDGAGYWQRVRYVLVPAIMPVIVVTVIVLTINYFNMVVLVLDLTGGGPTGATEILGLRLYREAFEYFSVDTAATLTMVMLLINFVLAIFYFRALRRQAGGEA
ncbi:carbohydrate ABC transporter permease [Jiangella asiatica]|uniref:Sugar ABC transporter permease n=1 Tax=Jiangella asiatica TaxID=2530372 RepID=A0A4V6PFM3_9ACTN|nr:sugar ABC transporter permease [Jiangella asiatica]TDE09308.1 sugar ABC transporter permease [Jiangella asiatica]